MPVFSLLLWLCRRSRRASASRRDADDPRVRRLVRPSLEALESRLAPGNLLFADGMNLVNLLTPPGSTVAAAPGDPLPNPFGVPSASSSSTTGLTLSSLTPNNASSTATGRAATPTGSPSAAPTTSGSAPAPFSGATGASSSTLSNFSAASGPTTGASSGQSGMNLSSTSSGGGAATGGGAAGSGGSSSSMQQGGLGSSKNIGSVMITGFKNSKGQPLTLNNLTNDPKPIVYGFGTPGETLSFTIDGLGYGSTTVGANGQWAWAVPTALAQGDHTVVATSGGANFTSASMSATVSIDVTPPAVTLTAPVLADYQPPLLQVQVAANDSYGLDSTVHIDVDLKHDGSFTDPGDQDFGVAVLMSNGSTGTASFYLMTPLLAGVYSLRARVDDPAGNEGISAISTMIDNPSMGYVGSQPLLDLGYGVKYGTAIPMPGDPVSPAPQTPPGLTDPATGGLGPPNYAGTPTPNMTPGAGPVGPSGFNFLQFDSQGRVLVDVHSTLLTYLGGLTDLLTAKYGFSTVAAYPSQVMVQGWLPVNQILNLPNAANFGSVDPVYKAIVRSDPEGDALIKGPQFRASQGVTGAGEKVGIISDSVNEFAGGLADSVAAGALPNNVQVIQDLPGGGGTDEGRAMLEIVHEIAPGSALAFDTGAVSPQEMAGAISALAGVGSSVIADDIGYGDEPFFNSGVISQAAQSAVNQGIFYDSAAGNSGNEGYLATWNPVTATVGGTTGTFQNIQGGSALQTFTLPVGESIDLSFEWAAAFLEGGGIGEFRRAQQFAGTDHQRGRHRAGGHVQQPGDQHQRGRPVRAVHQRRLVRDQQLLLLVQPDERAGAGRDRLGQPGKRRRSDGAGRRRPHDVRPSGGAGGRGRGGDASDGADGGGNLLVAGRHALALREHRRRPGAADHHGTQRDRTRRRHCFVCAGRESSVLRHLRGHAARGRRRGPAAAGRGRVGFAGPDRSVPAGERHRPPEPDRDGGRPDPAERADQHPHLGAARRALVAIRRRPL